MGGGIEGPLMGICASRGNLKGMVMGFHFGIIAICFILLCVGVFALATGQSYGIWYGIGLPGVLGLVILGTLTPVVRNRYQEAELRRLMADDL